MKLLYVLGGIIYILFLAVSCHETDIDEIENSVGNDSAADTYVFPVCNYKLYFKTEIEVLDTLQTSFGFGNYIDECTNRFQLTDSIQLLVVLYEKKSNHHQLTSDERRNYYSMYYDFFSDHDTLIICNQEFVTFSFTDRSQNELKQHHIQFKTVLTDTISLNLTFSFKVKEPKEVYIYENYVHELMEGLVKIE